MAVKASGRFVPPSAFTAGTGKAFMVMLLALHVLSIFPRSTGKNTVKDR